MNYFCLKRLNDTDILHNVTVKIEFDVKNLNFRNVSSLHLLTLIKIIVPYVIENTIKKLSNF